VESFLAGHPPAQRVLVFIDQLEELFTVAGADERQQFIAGNRSGVALPERSAPCEVGV